MIKPSRLIFLFLLIIGVMGAILYSCRGFFQFSGHKRNISESMAVVQQHDIPRVAIANYGPHSSLEDTIYGIRKGLEASGFQENENINIKVYDVNFDSALIPQMLDAIGVFKPAVVVGLGTPISQALKQKMGLSGVIFSAVTDPLIAGLISYDAGAKMTTGMSGVTDTQDVTATLQFIKKILPNAKKIGFLYSTGEANDTALLQMLQDEAKRSDLEIVSYPVDHARDIALRMPLFTGKVDCIYVGVSAAVQPSLPVIASYADAAKIPVVNVDARAVQDGMVLASFGVDYNKVGLNTAKLIVEILNKAQNSSMNPSLNNAVVIYPKDDEHIGYINADKVKSLGIVIPSDVDGLKIIQKP